MNRTLYTLIYYLLLPLVFVRLLWRSFRAPDYRRRWPERLGYHAACPEPGGLWIHAVSVGETIAAVPLIRLIQKHYPELSLTVTTMTPTGSERVQALLGDSVFHQYAPYDTPCAVNRFLRRIQPRLVIIMETELWPNIIHQCHLRDIPVVIANARLSQRSAQGYQKLPKLTGEMLGKVTRVVAQGMDDGQRFIDLGLAQSQLRVAGSIKFDIDIEEPLREASRCLRDGWGRSRPVWVAGSTHQGEDELLLAVHHQLLKKFPDLLLILVPRHPERFDRVAELSISQGLTLTRRSSSAPVEPATQVLLGDTMGELMLFYAAADVAFVGGTLVERGGHNFLEPAALGVPVISGPHVFNFSAISELLVTRGAMLQIQNPTALADQLQYILQDQALQNRMSSAGIQVVAENRGALQSLYHIVTEFL